jgi:hypothetical protein
MNNYWAFILITFFCIQNVRAAAAKVEYDAQATAELGQYASAIFFYIYRAGLLPPPGWQHGRLLQNDYRNKFFAAVTHLVGTKKADPSVPFITGVVDGNGMWKGNLLVRILIFDKDFPDKGGLDVARVLLEHGADPNHGDLLVYASSQGIRLLGIFGAVDKPLDLARQNISSRLAFELVFRGSEPYEEKLEKIKALCVIGSDVNCSYRNKGETPLEILLGNEGYCEREKCEIIGVLVDHGLNLYERGGASLSLMKKQLDLKDVQELSRRFRTKVYVPLQEVDMLLPHGLANIVVDYLSREGCSQGARRMQQEENNKRLYDRLLRKSLDTLCKKRDVLNIRSRLEKDLDSKRMEKDVNQVSQQRILDPRLFRSRYLYTRSLKTRIKNDKLELRSGEVVAASTI